MNRCYILYETCSLDSFILVVADPHKSPIPEYSRLGGKGKELFLKQDLPFHAKVPYICLCQQNSGSAVWYDTNLLAERFIKLHKEQNNMIR